MALGGMNFITMIRTRDYPDGVTVELRRCYKVNGVPLPKAIFRWLWRLTKA